MKGVNLHRFPSGKGYVTAADDEFWSAALDLGICVTSHTNGGTTRLGAKNDGVFQYPRALVKSGGGERDPVSLLFRFAGEQPMAPLQMAMAGVFDRFPRLKIYWAESQCGWLPYSFDQIDDNYERNRYWGERDFAFRAAAAAERVFEGALPVGFYARCLGHQMPPRDRRRYFALGQRLRPRHRRLAQLATVAR